MQIDKKALQNIISDEDRLLFAENIPAEYLSDALGRRTGHGRRARVRALDRGGQRRAPVRQRKRHPGHAARRGHQSGGLDNSAVRWYHSGCIPNEPRART